MRIAYCTTLRLPSQRARAYQVAKVTEALKDLDHVVEIFSPIPESHEHQSFESYYRLNSPVRLHHPGQVPSFASLLPRPLGTSMVLRAFRAGITATLRERRKDFDVLYTRSVDLLPALTKIGIPVIVELDSIPQRGVQNFVRLLSKCRLVVALTSLMRAELIEIGVTSVPVIVEGDGVDLHDFDGLPSAQDTRASLSIPEGIPLLVFVGQLEVLGLSRGIPELLAALRILRQRGLEFRAVIAGGPESSQKKFSASLSEDLAAHVEFIGRIDHLKVPTLLVAADALLYPAPATKHPFFLRDHSPLTMVEYMGSCAPIVAAELLPLLDIADATMLTFCTPGDPEALSEAIRSVLEDPESARAKAAVARKHVEHFTWQRRMERILGALRV